MKTKSLNEAIVEQVLRDRPSSRNSRQTLCNILRNMWVSDGKNRWDDAEAIYRYARNIQNTKGLYQSDKQIKKLREQRAEGYRQEYKPEKSRIQVKSIKESFDDVLTIRNNNLWYASRNELFEESESKTFYN